jgi:hypothetical protein
MLCRYAECRALFIIMLNVIMPSAVMLNVVAPFQRLKMAIDKGRHAYQQNEIYQNNV